MNSTVACPALPDDHTFIALSIVKMIASVFSIMANGFVLHLLLRSRSFHSNVRLLLKNLTASAIVLSLGLATKATYNCYIWWAGLFEINAFMCELLETPWYIGGGSVTSAISFIGQERLITTIWKKRFSDSDRPSTLAYVMAAACWINGFGTFCPAAAAAFLDKTSLCYCFGPLGAPVPLVLTFVPLYFFMEAVTILCYVYLYWQSRSSYLNFTVNTTHHSLAERHQLLNNMETATLLAPIMIMHGFIYCGIVCMVAYLRVAVSDATGAYYVAAMTAMQSMEISLHPIWLLVKHKSLRKDAADRFPCFEHLPQETGVNAVTTVEFKNLQGSGLIKGGRLGGTGGLVDFRVKPEDHENILHSVWESGPIRKTN